MLNLISKSHRFLKTPLTAAVISCPFSGGQPREGVETGPVHLVEDGVIKDIQNLGYQVVSDEPTLPQLTGDQDPCIGKLKRPRLVSRTNRVVAETVGKHATSGSLCVTLGGDHSLGIGTVSGTLSVYPDACLIWVDAHADINTPETTESGNLHGCPVSFLLSTLKAGHSIEEFHWIKPLLDPSKLVYIGLRDIDQGERKILREHKIKAFSMHEIDKWGIGKVAEMALDAVNPNRNCPIHLSFDVDALDPSVAPSTGTPVRGGLTFREGHYICEAIAETGCLVSLDIMEVNPSLADTAAVAQTVSVGRSLARAALGETLL